MSKTESPVNHKALLISRAISSVINVSISAGILFLSAGRADWLFAWLYLFSYLVFQYVSLRVSFRHIQQKTIPQKQSTLNRVLEIGYSLTHPLTLILAGFEFNLTQNPVALGLTIQSSAFVVLLLVFGLMIWAQWENPYYHSQNPTFEEGQKVVKTGPYQFIRHPGYAGLFMLALIRPLLLGSRLGITTGLAGAAIILLRTFLEDRTLQKDSARYKQYALKVRHRIFSGIW